MRGEAVFGARLPGSVVALIGVVIVGALAPGAIGRELASAHPLHERAGTVRARSLTLHGHDANNTFVVRATGADSGTYAVDGGRPVRFTAIRSLTIDGVGGHDVCRIVNPRRGLFAPPGGIACNGGNRTGPRRGVLEVLGGRAASSACTSTRPGAGTLTNRLGRLVQVIRFTGLAPITDTISSPSYTFNVFSTNDTAELVNGPAPGELTIESATGGFENTTISNKQDVVINATGSGDAGELDNTASEAGLSSLTLNASTGISVRETILPGVPLTLNAAGGSITQTGAITLGPETLSATAALGVELSNPGNEVGFFHADAAGGPVGFSDDTPGPLNVEGVSATQDVMLSNAVGELNIASTVSSGSSSDLTVASGAIGGKISLSGGGLLTGGNVSLTADQITLAGGSVQAGGTAALTPYTVGRPIDLGSAHSGDLSLLGADLDAVNAGRVIIGDASAGPITVSAPIAPARSNSISLEGAGGFSATGSGSLSVPTLAVLDEGSTPRSWTITPASVTDGSGPAIRYSDAGTLTVTGGSGGDTFDVTGSVSTTVFLDGGTLANGTLDYDAQGRAVSGSLSPPKGAIDSPTVKPVQFSRMAGVRIINGAPAPLTCVLKAPTNTVKLAHSNNGKKSRAMLTLSAKCNQTARTTLTGTITELLRAKSKHRKAVTRTVHIPTLRVTLAGDLTKLLVVRLPRSAQSALTNRIKEAASFTLAAANSNGNSKATLAIPRLKLQSRKPRH
jgi:hypothetical protein